MLVDRGEHIACLLRQNCIVSSSGTIVNKELKVKRAHHLVVMGI